jgi:CxxC motif-containing protein (DUF1111 family)
VTGAFALDLGLSTARHLDPAGDCTAVQATCQAAPHGAEAGNPEIAPVLVASLVRFLESVPPPRPLRTPDPVGARLFAAIGCAACHVPVLPDGRGGILAPYSNLLLHDLGDDLAGAGPEGEAVATEWRTAPLWGLGTTLRRGARLLHDGRAASIAEAVRHHGGEAAPARARFEVLPRNGRLALERFLSSL